MLVKYSIPECTVPVWSHTNPPVRMKRRTVWPTQSVVKQTSTLYSGDARLKSEPRHRRNWFISVVPKIKAWPPPFTSFPIQWVALVQKQLPRYDWLWTEAGNVFARRPSTLNQRLPSIKTSWWVSGGKMAEHKMCLTCINQPGSNPACGCALLSVQIYF